MHDAIQALSHSPSNPVVPLAISRRFCTASGYLGRPGAHTCARNVPGSFARTGRLLISHAYACRMESKKQRPEGDEQNRYKRKKQPKVVRKALIDEAVRLLIEGGPSAVTVQAVSDAAGVTKGGFMHHFPTKSALLNASFQELLDSIDRELDDLIAVDPETVGAFTRAYVQVVLDMDWESKESPHAALSIFMLTEPNLRALWAGWFNARVNRHSATDGSIKLAIVRLATDGIWLAELVKVSLPERVLLREQLLAATK